MTYEPPPMYTFFLPTPHPNGFFRFLPFFVVGSTALVGGENLQPTQLFLRFGKYAPNLPTQPSILPLRPTIFFQNPVEKLFALRRFPNATLNVAPFPCLNHRVRVNGPERRYTDTNAGTE